MNMMQVRWSLKPQTNTKKRTLACDYDPIRKRLRDFGHEAQELVHNAEGKPVTKPINKSRKAAPAGAKKEKPAPAPPMLGSDALAAMQPVSLQSIVDELEGAGLLQTSQEHLHNKNDDALMTGSARGGTSTPPPTRRSPSSVPSSPPLSLGAAGLLSAAGLLPDETSAPAVGALAADEETTEASESGSSFGGDHAATILEDTSDTLDPLDFLEGVEGAPSPMRPKTRAAPPALTPSSSSASTLAAPEDAVDPHDGSFLWPAPSAPVPLATTASLQSCAPESPTPAAPHALADADALEGAEGAEAGDMVLEELANELETDHSQGLLHELGEMYSFGEAPAPTEGLDANDLLFNIESSAGGSLLADLGGLSASADSMTFDGFNGKDLMKAMGAKGKGAKGKGGAKAASEGDAASKKRRADAAPASKPAKTPQVFWTHPSQLPPPPNSGVKFLPGAVQTPAPLPTKDALCVGKSAKKAPSNGRTFSWQPIKMPVYK